MNDVGCGYIALINSLFYEFIIHDESEFQEIFGFRPYELVYDENGKLIKDYNYEYLYLDFFLWIAKNTSYIDMQDGGTRHEGYETIPDLIKGMDGSRIDDTPDRFIKYLEEKGIPVKFIDGVKDSNGKIKPLDEVIEEYRKKGLDYVIILSNSENNFDLYYPYDKDGNGKLDDICVSMDGKHSMTVVGTTSDPNKIIVSSWGEEYLLDLSQVNDCYYILDYSEYNK